MLGSGAGCNKSGTEGLHYDLTRREMESERERWGKMGECEKREKDTASKRDNKVNGG